MNKRIMTASAVASVGLLAAGIAPATAMTGGKCTEIHTGNSSINVAVVNGATKIVCVGGGSDTVTISSAPAAPSDATRLVLVKSKGHLNVVWNAGPSEFGGTSLTRGEFTIIRPSSDVTVTASNGASPNTNSTGANALCGTNQQYAQAADMDAFANGAEIQWYVNGIFNVINDFCVPNPG